jgi:flagellar biosynthesis protein FlhF
MPALPDTLRAAYLRLCEQDVAGDLAAEIVQSVYAHLTPDRMSERRTVDEMVCSRLASMVPPVPPEGRRRRKTSVIALVGPTGVGKTTTLAKLAALAKLVRRQDVGLISADTYRIGAVEQLRTFAAIADIPMAVAYKPVDVATALRAFRGKDVVFIDTVGRSQKAAADLKSLGRLLGAADPDEIHLVLNAATGTATALDIAGRFSILRPNRLILSKLDEAASFGPMLDVLRRHRIPVSYATTGQAVPDDVQPVDPIWLASRLYQGGAAHA